MRNPEDKIWGFWEADNLASKVCSDLSNLFTQYDKRIDIIYDDGLLPGNMYGYSKLIYWNDPSLSPSPSPTPSPILTQTPDPIENPALLIDYAPAMAIVAVIAVVAVPVLMLRKRQYYITFSQTGVERDFTDTVVVVDGESYDRYGASFRWDAGSRHTFEFKSPIEVKRGKQYAKQYVWIYNWTGNKPK